MSKSNNNNNDITLDPAKQDYLALEEEMKYWNCENTHKPFDKNIVCLLGVYSSGKSSFANYFFKVGIQIVAPTQQDTIFTMIETVNEVEFATLVKERTGRDYVRKKIPDHLRLTPVEQASDPRRNILYMTLDTASTLSRHSQFDDFSKVFREYNLISSILINERYLSGSPEEINMYKNTIIIDSPGFTSETNIGKLKGNLRVLKYFFQLSDLILFLCSADSLSNISSEVNMLELSILYATEGESYFRQAIDNVFGNSDDNRGLGIMDFFGSFINQFRSSNQNNSLKYDGTSHWNKVNFVITKLDVGRSCSCGKELRAEGQYFELGITLGKTLKFLKPPVFDKCFAISLQRHQKANKQNFQLNHNSNSNNNNNGNVINSSSININNNENEYYLTGDLKRLIHTIYSLNHNNSFTIRLENSIQKMCHDLYEHINNTKWVLRPTTSYSTIKSILDRSKQRLIHKNGGK